MVILLTLAGCEVIKEEDRMIPLPTPTGDGRTHVLLEYTGFRCVNCPNAAETAEALQQLYGERLIVVSFHPASNPFTQGKYDYTCPEADSIYRYMGGDASTPFPTGNIDMVATDGSYFHDPTEWSALLTKAMEDTAAIPLFVTARMDESTRLVHIDAQYSAYANCRPTFWLVEDSVPGVQAMPDGSVNMEYYHRHVLRAMSDEPTLTIPDGCNPLHCSVVALLITIYDKQILQAYETHLDD